MIIKVQVIIIAVKSAHTHTHTHLLIETDTEGCKCLTEESRHEEKMDISEDCSTAYCVI